jgi:predicted regulator of amino acid metabolism with ACT domain
MKLNDGMERKMIKLLDHTELTYSEIAEAVGVHRQEVEIPWQKLTVKENLWKPVQAVVVRKAFTEDLAIDEHNDVYNILHRWLVTEKGWPCPAWPDRWNANPKKIK